MRTFLKVIMYSCAVLLIMSCGENDPKPIPQIALEHHILNPNSEGINLDADSAVEIRINNTSTQYMQGMWVPVQYTESMDSNYLISWGGKSNDPLIYEYLLAEDSTINGLLEWENQYISWGSHNFFPLLRVNNYVGIRYVSSPDTFYGWAYLDKSVSLFREYAIDTSKVKGVVKAGQLYKTINN